jgi:hypothetical protein
VAELVEENGYEHYAHPVQNASQAALSVAPTQNSYDDEKEEINLDRDAE